MKTLERATRMALLLLLLVTPVFTQSSNKLDTLKKEANADVDKMKDFSAQMVDQVFSFGELGFQEFETSKYLIDILKKNGFQVREGVAGHGEGHNSGVPLNITAALAVKKIMEREKLSGTLMLWPGVAEELLGSKAYYIREGLFKDVDVCLFTHVGSDMSVTYGPTDGSGLVSVEYSFHGEAAHAAAAPWRGRSALDAVELMDVGWSYRREHLRPQQRSHRVIPDGGDQPNVVPPEASVWWYFREVDYPHISEMYEIGNTMAQAAAMMTGTKVDQHILGTAWPGFFNKTIAEVTYENIKAVGLPTWSEDDQTLAKGIQREVGAKPTGLAMKINDLREPIKEPNGGGSDDI